MCLTVWAKGIHRMAAGTVAMLWLGVLVVLTSSTLIGALITKPRVQTIVMCLVDWKGF